MGIAIRACCFAMGVVVMDSIHLVISSDNPGQIAVAWVIGIIAASINTLFLIFIAGRATDA